MDKIRNKIQKTDQKIIRLVGKRMKLAKKIGILKKEAGIQIWDKAREKELREMYRTEATKDGLSGDFTDKLFDVIFDESRRIQESSHI